MLELDRRRESLLAALATAHARHHIAESMYERLVAGVLAATKVKQLLRLADAVAARVHDERVEPERPAGAPTVEAAVAAFHDAVSWRGRRPPSREALFALLSPRAVLVDESGEHGREAHWSRVARWSEMTYFPFAQRELDGETTLYGPLAQRLSLFETTLCDDGSVIRRGVASVQLTHRDGRWLIHGVVAVEERDGQPITTLVGTRPR